MYYSSQYNDGAPGLLGDPMAMHRGDDFGYNQTADFGRGDIQFSGGGGGGNPYNNYDSFDDRVGFTDSMSSRGYSQQERSFDSMSFNVNMGGPSLQPQQSDLQDNMNYYRQNSLPDVGMEYNQPPFEQRNFSFASEEDDPHDAGFESRRDSFKDMDRERDRERNRRSQGRDRPRNNRRDDNWDRGSRRDRGDRDWTNGDRDRRRERRNSRERSMRDRSPRDDGSMELSNDSSRMDLSEEDMHGSPGRDRHRDWDHSRQDLDHERDRERDRDRHRERDRDRERSRSRDDRERDRDRDRGDREGERWMTEEPSATILLRGLNNNIVENDVIQELIRIGMPPKDVRFMRRVTGASRGFGFVEFQSQSEAQRWMDLNQGQLQLPGMGQRISMHYSAPRVSRDSRDQANRMDWMCKCGAHNFKRRDFCYKCNTNRRLAEDPLCGVTELDPATHVGKNPCNTLLFRDLDALTTEQGVLQAIAALTSMAIKNTQVIRDDMSTSLCFAFLELNSVASAKQLHDFLQAQNPPLAIDGKQVMVSYAKNTFNTSLDIISKAQQKLQQNQYYLNYSNYYAQGGDANSQYYNYSQYYGTDTAATTTTTDPTPPANSTNAAAAVAQTAIMQAQAAKTLATSSTAVSTPAPETTSTSQYPVYPAPDVTKYQYDKTSGYYYDPTTGLYYEPNTQYYYNAKTTQWMYWDAEKSTYLPAPTQGTESSQSTEMDTTSQAQTEKTEKEEKKEKEKTKVAKKIAKDMEKWAKAMNAQKDAIKEEQRKNTIAAGRKESAAADAGFAILQKSKEDMKLMPPPPLTVNPAPDIAVPSAAAAGGSKAGLVASYGGDSDDSADEDDVGTVDESKLVDWSKLACLLCKRQFQSREILTKHTQFSDLHRQNLEKLKAKSSAGKVEKKEYRDRAKERRQKYGTPTPPEPRKQAVVDLPEVYEQPTKAGIGADNIGNKMLQKMGWSAGLGLGKSNQGLTAPIETQRRAATAGLGARGANIVAEEGASYKDNVKKTLFARYNEAD